MTQSPHAQGYRWPAEWEPHRATWIAWPHNAKDWPDKFAPIPWAYVEFVRAITQGEPCGIVVKNQAMADAATGMLERGGVDLDKVELLMAPTNRVWLRDSGPIFLKHADGRRAALQWRFNAWAKYPNHQLDARLPERLCEALGVEYFVPVVEKDGHDHHVVLEGGAIDGNGAGTMLTTEECLLSQIQERNIGFGRGDYERIFREFLGIEHTIWLDRGIVGDDTHGHVDDIARFVAEDMVVAVVEPDKHDPNHAILKENLKRLKAARTAQGKALTVAELPMPKPVYFEGERLPASYANFLITNSAVLIPTFNDPADREALNVMAQLFPKRDIIPLPCRDLVWGLGTLHCASQQEPA